MYIYIWKVLMFLIDIYELFCWLFILLRSTLLRSYDLCRSHNANYNNNSELIMLERCRKILIKKPRHIAVIVGATAKHINEQLFERLFRYALYMDIDCVSVYVAGERNVQLQQIAPPKYVHNECIDSGHYRWTSETSQTVTNGKLENGVTKSKHNGHLNNGMATNGTCAPHKQKNEKSLEIFQFSTNDNYAPIAVVCRDLFAEKHTTKVQQVLKERTELMHYIDKELNRRIFGKLKTNSDFSFEPELCIVFNMYLSTYGMLPWHTRFTEFYNYKTGAGFDAFAFANVLCHYSRCEQRWGK